MDSKDYEVGYGKPPKNKQFGQPDGNPQRKGLWDISSTPRFKLEQMMKMSGEELQALVLDKSRPFFEMKLAKALVDGDWKTIKEMIAEVYGTPKTSVDVTSGGKQIKTVVEIIDARSTRTNTD